MALDLRFGAAILEQLIRDDHEPHIDLSFLFFDSRQDGRGEDVDSSVDSLVDIVDEIALLKSRHYYFVHSLRVPRNFEDGFKSWEVGPCSPRTCIMHRSLDALHPSREAVDAVVRTDDAVANTVSSSPA